MPLQKRKFDPTWPNEHQLLEGVLESGTSVYIMNSPGDDLCILQWHSVRICPNGQHDHAAETPQAVSSPERSLKARKKSANAGCVPTGRKSDRWESYQNTQLDSIRNWLLVDDRPNQNPREHYACNWRVLVRITRPWCLLVFTTRMVQSDSGSGQVS